MGINSKILVMISIDRLSYVSSIKKVIISFYFISFYFYNGRYWS